MKKKHYAGYIRCRYLKKTINISIDAVANPAYGFICACGRWTGESHHAHSGMYKGEKL